MVESQLVSLNIESQLAMFFNVNNPRLCRRSELESPEAINFSCSFFTQLETMADALISAVLTNLNSIISEEVYLLAGFNTNLKKLSSTLTAIKAVLEDAEVRQAQDKSVRNWLDKLRNVAYDVDDILEDWKVESLQLRRNETRWIKKVRNMLPYRFLYVDLVLKHELGYKMKEINEKLVHIVEEKNRYQFNEIRSTDLRMGQETISRVEESEIYGRDETKDQLVNKLLSEDGGESHTTVISIVGMGGIGKTTLAQLVYNDERVKTHFDRKAWAYVSKDFNVREIAKTMIEAVAKMHSSRKSHDRVNFEIVQARLGRSLAAKRFLLVLDDVWNEDDAKWDVLKVILNAGAKGSKIIVTTRNEKVALTMGSAYVHHLDTLSYEYCWSIFQRRAFITSCNKNSSKCVEIQKIRTRMAGPPPQLKPCFAYCSIYPKDWRIAKDTMVKHWMAQGFIRQEGRREMEEIGADYFDELLGRSLLQEAEVDELGEIRSCKMHDLVHDLHALTLCGSHTYCQKYGGRDVSVSDEEIQKMECIFEGLRPCTNIKELSIHEHVGYRLPSWLEDRHFTRLSKIMLQNCKCQQLPALGELPSLKHLSLHSMYELRHIERNSKGPGGEFPKLLTLDMFDFPKLEDWKLSVENGDMPCLNTLNITYCHKFKALPTKLPDSLKKLKLVRCEQLNWEPSQPLQLEHLELEGTGIPSTIKATCLPNLRHLKIGGHEDVPLMLQNGLQGLQMLEILKIESSFKLHSLPADLPTPSASQH